jgi:hypothetical protein
MDKCEDCPRLEERNLSTKVKVDGIESKLKNIEEKVDKLLQVGMGKAFVTGLGVGLPLAVALFGIVVKLTA